MGAAAPPDLVEEHLAGDHHDGDPALAQQLDARVEVLSGPQGTTVSITHATFVKMGQTAWKAADLASISGHA